MTTKVYPGEIIGCYEVLEFLGQSRDSCNKPIRRYRVRCTKFGTEYSRTLKHISKTQNSCRACREYSSKKRPASLYPQPLDPELMALARRCWR